MKLRLGDRYSVKVQIILPNLWVALKIIMTIPVKLQVMREFLVG